METWDTLQMSLLVFPHLAPSQNSDINAIWILEESPMGQVLWLEITH
jgi:hypothetical protein